MANSIILEKVITHVIGRAVPKPEDKQNTDDMVYGGELNRITFKGYGKDLFANERKNNPNHPLNNSKYAGAKILIGGENYGCGSSREHAPQAHLDYGFRALITAGYAGIFQANCAAIGLVAIVIDKADVTFLADLVKNEPNIIFDIDLNLKHLKYKSLINYVGPKIRELIHFEIPESIRRSFLNGTWDALALLRNNPEKVIETIKKVPYFGFR